jgi:hypothetical protein
VLKTSLQYAGQSVEEVHPALMRLEAEGGMLLIDVNLVGSLIVASLLQ